MTVVISGASGQFGRRAAQRVLETLPPNQLILVTRRPDALRDLAERGVVVRRGDFNDPDSLPDAFAGGDKLLLISTDALGTRVAQHGAAIKAAVRAGVRSIAYTSAVNPTESNPMAVAVEHRATEEAVRASGLAWTFLRNSIYADLLPRAAAQALATGQLIHNEGDGRTSYVAREDCAAAAAAVLTSEGHEGNTYDITGPEALSQADLALLYTELGGRPVTPAFLDDEAWVATMVRHVGMDEPAARLYATFGTAARRWYAAPLSTTVEDLTGRLPRRVRDVLAEHRAELVAHA